MLSLCVNMYLGGGIGHQRIGQAASPWPPLLAAFEPAAVGVGGGTGRNHRAGGEAGRAFLTERLVEQLPGSVEAAFLPTCRFC